MEKKQVRPFGMADKIGYMFGDFGNDFTFILSSMFLMKFYTDVMQVSPAVVGLMMMAARFVDAFSDVIMGQVVDHSAATEKGKFAPWLRRMMGPVAVASLLMYAVWFKDMPMGFKIFWMFFTYILWGSVCYTGINIPYGSMASALSEDPKHRSELSTWRSIGATLAATIISVVLPLVVYYTDEAGNSLFSGERMLFSAVICSILAVVCYTLCYTLTTERVKIEKVSEKFTFGMLVRTTISNRALVGIILAALLLLIAQLTLNSMGNYIYPNYFNNYKIMSMINLIGSVTTLVLSTFMSRLSAKVGKKELATFGSCMGAVSLFAAFFLHTHSIGVWMVCYVLAYAGLSFFNIIVWAMITDVIDDVEIQQGTRRDGTIYSVYSFARKLGQAASSGLTGVLLSAIGYSEATAFEQDVVDGIYNVTTLVPALAFLGMAAVLWFVYPLSKKKVEENVAFLSKKNQANG